MLGLQVYSLAKPCKSYENSAYIIWIQNECHFGLSLKACYTANMTSRTLDSIARTTWKKNVSQTHGIQENYGQPMLALLGK